MNTIIYLDTFFVSNTFVNFYLLFLCAKFFTFKFPITKALMISSIGTVASLIVILYFNNGHGIHKIAISWLMIAFTFKVSTKTRIKLFSCLITFSMLFSGLNICIDKFTGRYFLQSHEYGTVKYSAFVISAFFLYLITAYILKLTSRHILNKNNYKFVEIFFRGQKIILHGFCDSGNTLRDTESNQPVFITDCGSIKKLINIKEYENLRSMPCQTILGNGNIKLLTPDKILVDNVEINAVVGITSSVLNADYDIILCNEMNFFNNFFTEMENLYV